MDQPKLNTIKVKINPSKYGFEQVKNDDSIRIVAFEYLIPRPIFPPVKRISKFYCVKGKTLPSRLKYNLPNFLFCWLGLPFGPISALQAYKKNKKGIDFSKDVKPNLKSEDYAKGFVVIEKFEEAFVHPDKSTLKELTKALNKYTKKHGRLSLNPIVGFNIQSDTSTYFIGLSTPDVKRADQILEVIYSFFYKHTKFKFISLDETGETADKLKEQGKEMILSDLK
jgi:hypothetical protein